MIWIDIVIPVTMAMLMSVRLRELGSIDVFHPSYHSIADTAISSIGPIPFRVTKKSYLLRKI